MNTVTDVKNAPIWFRILEKILVAAVAIVSSSIIIAYATLGSTSFVRGGFIAIALSTIWPQFARSLGIIKAQNTRELDLRGTSLRAYCTKAIAYYLLFLIPLIMIFQWLLTKPRFITG